MQKVLSIEEHKQVQLDILKFVAGFCEKKGLCYFLADGTLLGAVRHKGFIPWDDDIDIRMPRPDYNRMRQIFNEECKDSHYHLVDPRDNDAHHYFIKIIDTRTIKIEPEQDYSTGFLGVDIDVFPIEGSPENEEEFLKWGREIRSLNKAYAYKKRPLYISVKATIGTYVKKRVHPKWCWLFLSASRIAEKVIALADRYIYGEGTYVSFIGAGDLFRVPYECYKDYVMMKFEDAEFRVPAGYDAALTKQYGDYMKLPPIEKQVTHHANNVFWKDEEEENKHA
ncbi:LicD family protein [bacterium]|nr:LicD family protein [bacterium]